MLSSSASESPGAGAIAARLKHVNSPQITWSSWFLERSVVWQECSHLLGRRYLRTKRSGKTMPDRSSPLVWWIYALFMPLGVPVIATLFYAAAHKQVVPFKPANLFDQWWVVHVSVCPSSRPAGRGIWMAWLSPASPSAKTHSVECKCALWALFGPPGTARSFSTRIRGRSFLRQCSRS